MPWPSARTPRAPAFTTFRARDFACPDATRAPTSEAASDSDAAGETATDGLGSDACAREEAARPHFELSEDGGGRLLREDVAAQRHQ